MTDFAKYVAERLQWKASYAMPNPELLALPSAQLAVHVDDAINATVLQIHANFHAMVGGRVVVKEQWPATWVEAIKERWLPVFMKQIWPVKYHKIHIDQKIYGPVCPHQLTEPNKTHLEWMRIKG